MAASDNESSKTLQACALIGLHPLAAEGEAGSCGVSLLTLETCGDTVAPKARNGSVPAPLAVRCMSTTTSAGPLKSLGRIGGHEVVALFLED